MIFKELLLYVGMSLSLLGSLVIVYASFRAMGMFINGIVTNTLDIPRLRLALGYGIILGLEFMIGADIIGSVAKPTYHDIGILAALVGIRTFLSYFLGKELAAVSPEVTKSMGTHS